MFRYAPDPVQSTGSLRLRRDQSESGSGVSGGANGDVTPDVIGSRDGSLRGGGSGGGGGGGGGGGASSGGTNYSIYGTVPGSAGSQQTHYISLTGSVSGGINQGEFCI